MVVPTFNLNSQLSEAEAGGSELKTILVYRADQRYTEKLCQKKKKLVSGLQTSLGCY